jgi:uncharacterized membrane protein
MLQLMTTVLLWFLAIGCGVMAGVYFAFSAFVMTSLGRIDQAAGIAAMNAINSDIVRSLFMPLFMGTTLASAAVAVVAVLNWGHQGMIAGFAGALVYVIGMFVITMVFNVPLNDALAAVDPAAPEASAVWRRYLGEWTQWNHVRTLASGLASALFIVALTRIEL